MPDTKPFESPDSALLSSRSSLLPLRFNSIALLMGGGVLLIGGTLFSHWLGFDVPNLPLRATASMEAQSANPVVQQSVVALGRLEPQGEVLKLSTSDTSQRLAELRVQRGDRVKTGQVIAVLDAYGRLQAALQQAQQQVVVAQTRLAQVQAGAKQGEINAQQATIEQTAAQLRQEVQARQATVTRLMAEVANAEMEYQRYETLYQSGAVSASLRDGKQLTLDAAQAQLQEAKANRDQANATLSAQLNAAQATLDQIAEVRPVDVAAAQAEVENARAAVQRAQAELDLAVIRAPRDGQILKVHAWPGETIGTEGIVDLGQTDRMDAIAEVYESDIARVQLGQRVQISSLAMPDPVWGEVTEVGLQVLQKGIRDTNPTADTDARVIEVKVAIDPAHTAQVQQLTNLEVTMAFLEAAP